MYVPHVVFRGSGGMLPQENFVNLDTRRALLRPFLGPKFHMFCSSALATKNLLGDHFFAAIIVKQDSDSH